MREALDALELVVVIDVALTETARHAHYVLPAPSQFEKWEATFFTLEFPENVFQLRAPLFPALPGTLAEPEIHRRLVRAIGALDGEDLAPLHAAAAAGRAAFAPAFLQFTLARPDLAGLVPVILYETLGPTLRRRQRSGVVALGRRAHLRDELPRVGAARRVRRATAPRSARRSSRRSSPDARASLSPSTSTTRPGAGSRTPDGKINLDGPASCMGELARSRDRGAPRTPASSRSC